MVFGSPFEHVLMSTITEWCVCTEFAITELVVSTLGHVEIDWTTSGHNPFALPITEGTDLGMSTAAPLVDLGAVKVDMRGIDTLVGGHTWWSISTLLVWSALRQVHNFLLREISYIFHRYRVSRSWRLHQNWCWSHYVSFMCLHLRTSWSINQKNCKYDLSIKCWINKLRSLYPRVIDHPGLLVNSSPYQTKNLSYFAT